MFPLDPQFSFYYEQWCQGFAEFASAYYESIDERQPPTLPEIDELDFDPTDDSFFDFESDLFYMAWKDIFVTNTIFMKFFTLSTNYIQLPIQITTKSAQNEYFPDILNTMVEKPLKL